MKYLRSHKWLSLLYPIWNVYYRYRICLSIQGRLNTWKNRGCEMQLRTTAIEDRGYAKARYSTTGNRIGDTDVWYSALVCRWSSMISVWSGIWSGSHRLNSLVNVRVAYSDRISQTRKPLRKQRWYTTEPQILGATSIHLIAIVKAPNSPCEIYDKKDHFWNVFCAKTLSKLSSVTITSRVFSVTTAPVPRYPAEAITDLVIKNVWLKSPIDIGT